MKKYATLYTIQAEPMNELVAEEEGYIGTSIDRHEYQEGYHVIHPDGQHGWMSKKDFKAKFTPLHTYRERLEHEAADLASKISRLCAFMQREDFKEIPYIQQKLMEHQKVLMELYLETLNKRIDLMDFDEAFADRVLTKSK